MAEKHWKRMGSSLLGGVLVFGLAGSAGFAGSAMAANKSRLSIYQKGKAASEISCTALPARSVVLAGGGADVKAAFSWMIEQSRACATPRPGNFVVVRIGGSPAYDSFIYKLGPLASVQTLVVPDIEAANDPALEPYLRKASAIWLTGGDQGDYYAQWRGTRLAHAMWRQIADHRIPVGGTSAGMMMMSEFNYLATPLSVSSAEALANPYAEGRMTIANDFWSSASEQSPPQRAAIAGLENVITDSHFSARDRMGRLLAFLARILTDGEAASLQNARAIGVDQETALLLEYADDDTGSATRYTARTVSNPGVTGYAYVLTPTTRPTCAGGSVLAATCGSEPGAFNFTNINALRLGDGSRYDFISPINASGNVAQYRLDITAGVLSGTLSGSGVY